MNPGSRDERPVDVHGGVTRVPQFLPGKVVILMVVVVMVVVVMVIWW
jgi:hypothetical protein